MNDAMTTTLFLDRPAGTIPPSQSTGIHGRGAAVSALVKVLAALLVVAAIGWILFAPVDPLPESVAVLEVVHGSVTLFPTGKADVSRLLDLTAEKSIDAGAVIETTLSSQIPSRAAIRMAGGPSIRLDTDTRVRVDSDSALVLERGAVYVDSEGQSAVEVRTTLGVVRDVGTQFEVRKLEDGTLRVRVREGRVVLTHEDASYEAGAGVELRMDADGTLTRGTNAIHGPDWSWVLETAPAPDVDGRPLREVLEWVAREGGWTLRFADGELEDLSASTTLHGTVEDLTPTEVAAMVLKGSDLGYRLDDGTLVVEPASR